MWTTAWTCQMTDFTQFGLRVKNHTQRVEVVPYVGGERVRVRLANPSAAEDLVFSSAVVYAEGESVPLTYGGHDRIVIPAGGCLITDPVELAVKPGRKVSIETTTKQHLVSDGSVFMAPYHTDVLSSGSVEGQPAPGSALPPLDDNRFRWSYGLSSLMVETASAPASVVAFGDSITASGHWTRPLLKRLAGHDGGSFVLRNAGLAGNRLLRDAPAVALGFGPSGRSRFEDDVFGNGAVDTVIVLEGVNDLCHPTSFDLPLEAPTAGELIGGLTAIAETAKERDARVVGGTILPFRGHPSWSPAVEEVRAQVNDWIRATNMYDAYIDFDLLTCDPQDHTKLDPRWDSSDHLHLSPAGGEYIAHTIDISALVREGQTTTASSYTQRTRCVEQRRTGS